MRLFVKCSAAALLLCSASAFAQVDRAGTWEMGGTLLDISSVSVEGIAGTSLRVDDETGWGFSGAYNFTNRLAVGLDVTWSDPAYVATWVPDNPPGLPQRISANLDVSVIHFKGIFNVLDTPITPYLEFGAGWTYLDSNIIDDYGGTFCWWDPWWGYVCNTYYDTYADTRTSISYAAGIRWDIASTMVFKASWGIIEIDKNRGEDFELDTIQVTFGWKF